MNILSFDIEEWYLEKTLHGGREAKYRSYDELFGRLLDHLEQRGIQATFFCVGKLAEHFPHVVKAIADRGHEVGCHSNRHTWLTQMDPRTLRRDTAEALDALQNVCGKRVVSYRAPAFSITEGNKWALEVLAQCGIENDSSVFPAVRDFGGWPSFVHDEPCRVRIGGATLREFPIGLTPVLGRRMAYSGGGYFRLLPYGLASRAMRRRAYNICYFHLNDLANQKIKLKTRQEYEEYFHEPGTLRNRLARYAKSNIGAADGFGKLQRLTDDFDFTSIRDANIDWTKAITISL